MAALKLQRANRGHGLLRSNKLLVAMVESIAATKKYSVDVQITQADLIGNVLQNIVVAHNGFLIGIDSITQLAITTGGTITVQVNGVATGAVITHVNADAIGVRKTANPTAPVAVVRGDRVQLVLAGFATAGAVNAHVGFAAD
jgi:hypothetical protein